MANTMFPLQVSPTIPPQLRRLVDLAQNFWFSWYPETGQLFRKLDTVLWRKVDGNPKLFLRDVLAPRRVHQLHPRPFDKRRPGTHDRVPGGKNLLAAPLPIRRILHAHPIGKHER